MRKNYMLLIFLLVAAYVYGQQAVDVPGQHGEYIYKSDKVKAYESHFFGCPQCSFVSKVNGVCPFHQVPLLKIGTYYCPVQHHYTAAKKGSCPEHKVALKEMEITYGKLYPAQGDKSDEK